MKSFLPILLLAVLSLTACNGHTRFDDVTVKIQNEQPTFYQGKSKFTGQLWTSDDKISYEVSDGQIKKTIFYHKNGKVAGYSSPDGKNEYFDEEGKPIDQNKFAEKYLDYYSDSLLEFFQKVIQPNTK